MYIILPSLINFIMGQSSVFIVHFIACYENICPPPVTDCKIVIYNLSKTKYGSQ